MRSTESDIESYVTEWGFPALCWRDRVATMVGNPREPLPKVREREIERRLWVHRDGATLLALDHEGAEWLLGRWDAFERLVVGTTRTDLSPEQVRLLGMSRLQWVEHHTLDVYFRDKSVRRISVNAVAKAQVQRMHDVISERLVKVRLNYEPPQSGRCWRKSFLPELVALGAGEKSETRLDVGAAETGIAMTDDSPVASVTWDEPVAAKGWMGGQRRHRVRRRLFAARGYREDSTRLCFRSYKAGTEGVVEVNADLGFLRDFRVADSAEADVAPIQPVKGMLPGVCIVAELRYGLTLPLTSADSNDSSARAGVKALADLLQRRFLPLVGETLSDEQLGLKPAAKG